MVDLSSVLSESEQAAFEQDLIAGGKGRALHKGRADETQLRELVERHLRFTGSTLALKILDDWDAARARFVKVFPHEYQRALSEMHAKQNVKAAAKAKSREAA
jgi:glutamate synthase domain-containing protein 3